MKKKKRKKILREWSLPKNRHFNFQLISQYSNYKNQDNSSSLSEKTLIDLDFNRFFEFADRTSSAIGQQYLYHQFISQKSNEDNLKNQESAVQFYDSHPDNRLNSQLLLHKLEKPNDYYFPYLIFSELPKKIYNSWLILFLQLSIIISILLIFVNPIFFLATILTFTANLFFHYAHKNKIGNFTIYFSRLSSLANSLRKLIPLSNISASKKSNLISDIKQIEGITSQVLFLKTDNLQNSEIGSVFWFVFELIKVATLSEIVVFNKLVNKIRHSRPQIEQVYIALGQIDVAISICSLRAGLEYFSIPHFLGQEKELTVKDLYHPLVQDCIPNDISLKNKGLLLTGSNMAGKSTFIKALNLNALSAQVINTSFTNTYVAPRWQLMTSMTIKDNITENSSYYLEEVHSIGQLIEASEETKQQYLFTIDEIFKGTNTIERISTAKAILEYINKHHHMILVSTHDIELTKLLNSGFDLYYFQESVSDNQLVFDYKIQKGTLQKSNAIRLLEITGYPKTITDEARKMAVKLVEEKTGLDLD